MQKTLNKFFFTSFFVYERGGGGRTTEPLRKGINFYFIEGKNGQKGAVHKKTYILSGR